VPIVAKKTYADYAAMPEGAPYYQLVEGELIMSPAPDLQHQVVLANLFTALRVFVAQRKLGLVLCAPVDVILSNENVLQPDIVLVTNDSKALRVPEGLRGAPDLCVEVLSKTSRALDLGKKRELYAKHGVIEYWVVDPAWNTVDVFRFKQNLDEPVQTLDEKQKLTTDLLTGFSLDLSEVFAP
jgi:Uma2 family endonuclease